MKIVLSLILGCFLTGHNILAFSADIIAPEAEDVWKPMGECIGHYQDVSEVERQLRTECTSQFKEGETPNIGKLKEELRQKNVARVACIPAINLCGADLHGADLDHASLDWADLKKSQLFDANLNHASLINANLTGADIRNADLTEADLSYAILQDADLGFGFGGGAFSLDEYDNLLDDGANLTRANLRGADLRGANLNYAVLNEAVFELIPGTLPDVQHVVFARGLWSMTYYDSPHSLIELREAFKKAGLRQQEREKLLALLGVRRCKKRIICLKAKQIGFYLILPQDMGCLHYAP